MFSEVAENRLFLTVAACGAFVALINSNPAKSGEIGDLFEKYSAQVKKGVGGYEGEVRPFTGCVLFQLDAFSKRTVRHESMYKLLVGGRGPAIYAAAFEHEEERQIEFDEFLARTSRTIHVSRGQEGEIENFSYDVNAIPQEYRVVAQLKMSGELLHAQILDDGDAKVGSLDLKSYQSVVGEFMAGMAYPSDCLSNGGTINRALVFDEYSGFRLDRDVSGHPPTIRGVTNCGPKECVVIEFNEQLKLKGTAAGEKVDISASIVGYVLLDKISLSEERHFVRYAMTRRLPAGAVELDSVSAKFVK